MHSTPERPGRFHLLLSSHGRPVQHGWWNSESVGRGKLSRWVGEYGTMPGGRVTLTDEETDTVMQVWPQEYGLCDVVINRWVLVSSGDGTR